MNQNKFVFVLLVNEHNHLSEFIKPECMHSLEDKWNSEQF